MLFLFDVVVDGHRIRDLEGGEFADLAAAKAEALRCAGDQGAEELRNGRAFPGGWKIEVRDNIGNLKASVLFASLIASAPVPLPTQNARGTVGPQRLNSAERHRRTEVVSYELEQIIANVRATIAQIRKRIGGVA